MERDKQFAIKKDNPLMRQPKRRTQVGEPIDLSLSKKRRARLAIRALEFSPDYRPQRLRRKAACGAITG